MVLTSSVEIPGEYLVAVGNIPEEGMVPPTGGRGGRGQRWSGVTVVGGNGGSGGGSGGGGNGGCNGGGGGMVVDILPRHGEFGVRW